MLASAFVLAVTVLGMQLPGAATAESERMRAWAEGPVRWLLLPDERRQARQIEEDPEGTAFIEAFWERRNPQSGLEGENLFRKAFEERVQAADLLYSEEGIRGSLTDRGRALILLGSPTHVTISTEPIMAWDPSRDARDRVTMHKVDVEIWGYRMQDLPPRVFDVWSGKRKATEDTLALTLRFRRVGRRTALVEGESLLAAAAEAVVTEGAGE